MSVIDFHLFLLIFIDVHRVLWTFIDLLLVFTIIDFHRIWLIEFHWFALMFIDFQRVSLIFVDFMDVQCFLMNSVDVHWCGLIFYLFAWIAIDVHWFVIVVHCFSCVSVIFINCFVIFMDSLMFMDAHWFSLIYIDVRSFLLIFSDFHHWILSSVIDFHICYQLSLMCYWFAIDVHWCSYILIDFACFH